MTDTLKNNLNQPVFEYNGNKQESIARETHMRKESSGYAVMEYLYLNGSR